jgi:pimeloyl-ACP methyl ester carboxylesterase
MNTWLNPQEYPFQSRYFQINGVKQHYIDEGNGDILLFVHGTPTWSFDFRHLIRYFRNTHRCIAIDHIGFGLSDKPSDYDYSTVNHSRTLEKFIAENDLEKITLVVHDFGGPIALHYAMRFAHNVKRLVILNSWLWSSKGLPEFQKTERLLKSPLLSFLYLYLNFSAKVLLPKSFGVNRIEPEILKHYTKPFANKSQRYGTLAFAQSLLNDQDWFEQLWMQKEFISNKETLLIWGMKDAFVTLEFLTKFQMAFRNAQSLLLEEAGHYPHEEQPAEVINAMVDFLCDTKSIL